MRAKEIKAINDLNVLVDGNLALLEGQGDGNLTVVEFVFPPDIDIEPIFSEILKSYSMIERKFNTDLVDVDIDMVSVSVTSSYGMVEKQFNTDLADVDLSLIETSITSSYGMVEKQFNTDLADVDIDMVSVSVTSSYGMVEKQFNTDLADVDIDMVSASVTSSYGMAEKQFNTDLADVDIDMVSASVTSSYGMAEKQFNTDLADVDLPIVYIDMNSTYGMVEKLYVAGLVDVDLSLIETSITSSYGMTEKLYVAGLVDVDLSLIETSITSSYGMVEKQFNTDLADVDIDMVSVSVTSSYGMTEKLYVAGLVDVDLSLIETSITSSYGMVEKQFNTDLSDVDLPLIETSITSSYGMVERYFETNNITRQYLSDYPNFSTLSFNGLANIQNTNSANPISYDIGNAENPVFIGPHSTDLVINLNAYTSVEVGETKSIKIIPQMGQLAHGDILGLDGNNTIAGTTITYRPDNNSKEVDSFYYAVIGTSPETSLSMDSNTSTCFVETSHRERQYLSTANAFNSLGFASSLVLSIPDQDSPVFSSYIVPDIDKNVTASFRLPAADYETVAITEQPTSGVLNYMASQETSPVKTGPYFTYQPLADTPVDFDDDVFTFTVKLMGVDPTVSYVSSQFTLRVKNTPPQVNNDFSQQINEDSDTGYQEFLIDGLNANGQDLNGDTIMCAIQGASFPEYGTVVLSTNTLSYKYTPNPHWHGSDKFYYKARELTNSIWSEQKEIQIQVDSVYDSPQATVLTGGVSDEGGYIAYTMVGTSNEFAGAYDLRYQLMQNPTENGTVVGHFTNTTDENILAVGEGSALLTSPVVEIHADDTDYFGTGTWKYRVVDINRTLNGSLLADAKSSIVECSYLFNNVNDAPTAIALSPNVNEDQLTQIDLSFSDAYNETGTYSYSIDTHPSGPNAGILSGGCINYPASSFVNYLSKSNYVGTDTFTYIVNDGALNSAAASVTVNVLNTPDAPVADDLTVVVVEDGSVNFTVPHVDVDPGEESNLRVYWTTEPPANRGTIGLTGGDWNLPGVFQYSFTPYPHNTLSTSATYLLWDGTFLDPNGNTDTSTAGGLANRRISAQKTISFQITPFDDPMEWIAHPTTMSVQEQQTGAPATYNTIDIQAIDPDVLGSNILTGQDPVYSIKTQGSKGVATIAPVSGTETWRITYTLNDVEYTQSTTDTFTYRATNSTNPEITEVCTVTILPLDDMPTFTASPINIACTEVVGFTFLFADYIVDPDSTAFDIVKFEYEITDAPNPSYTKTWNPSGLGWNDANMPTAVYEWDDINHQLADSSVTQTDSFKWRVRDQAIGSAWSDEVTVNISIQGVNSDPVITAAPTALELYEDTISYFTFTATDAESTPIVYTFTQPTTGVVAVTTGSEVGNGTHKYTPPADYFGNPGTFTMSASDGTPGATGVNTVTTPNVTINVISVNDHPIAESQSLGTNEDVALPITLTGHDHPNKQGEDSPITFIIVDEENSVDYPEHGSLTPNASFVNNGIITYTPDLNYHGADSIKFKVNDGTNDSVVATITLAVHDINDPPIATPQTILGGDRPSEGGVKSITLAGTDVENNPLTFYLHDVLPQHGSLHPSETAATNGTNAYSAYQLMANPVWYKHDDSENHTDTFNFRARESTTGNQYYSTNPALVTINIIPVNDPPVASAQGVTVAEDSTDNVITLTTYASDVDTDDSTLTYTINGQPSHGTLTTAHLVDDKEIEYTPDPDFHGTDSVTFVANDGSLNSNTGVITITVTPVNDAPIAQSQGGPSVVTVDEDSAVNITLVATDVDGDALDYIIVAAPANGALKRTSDNYALGNGTLIGNQNLITFTPTADYNGSTSFTWKANDGTIDSNIATVAINVAAQPDPPVANNFSFSLNEDSTYTIDFDLPARSSDPDNDLYSWEIVSTTTLNGSLSVTSGSMSTTTVYTPTPNYYGAASFTWRVKDTDATWSGNATASITVNPIDDSFAWSNDWEQAGSGFTSATTATVNEDEVWTFAYSGSDVDNPTTSQWAGYGSGGIVVDATNPGQAGSWNVVGTVTNNGPIYTITWNPDWNGTAIVHLCIATATNTDPDPDVAGAQYCQAVTITVNPVDDPPEAANLPNIAVMEDASIAITLVGTDVEGNTLTYHITDMPTKGALSNYGTTSSSVTYTPSIQSLGYVGGGWSGGQPTTERETATDTFTYKVNDGTSDSSIATVTITITGVNDAPVATDFTLSNATTGTTNYNESGSNQYDWFSVSLVNRGSDVDTNDNLWYQVVSIPTGSKIRRLKPDGTTYNEWSSATVASSYVTLWYGGTHSSYSQKFDWQPATANWSGTETLTYRALDSGDGSVDDPLVPGDDRYSANKTITIVVAATADVPTTDDQIVAYTEDTAISFNAAGDDPDWPYGDYVKSVTIHAYASNWGASTLTIPDATLGKSLYWTFNRNIDNDYANTYVDWSFTDINDVQSNQSRINFNGTSVEDPTVWESYPSSDTVSGNENSGASISITATDADNTITYGIEEQLTRFAGAGGGTANGHPTLTHPSAPASGSFSISAVPNSDGSWYGTCKVFAEGSSKLVKTITVNLDSVNETPTAQDASFPIAGSTLTEDQTHTFDLDSLIADEESTDAELTVTKETDPDHGTASIDANTHIATYIPTLNYYGTDSWTYKVSDGVNSVVKTLSYTMASVNDTPTASTYGMSGGNYLASVDEDQTIDVYLIASDVETSNLTYAITSNPAHYSIWAQQGNAYSNHWKYQGAADNNDNISFGWKVTDAGGLEAAANGYIQINPVADTVAWLTAGDYTVTIQEDGSDVIQRGAADPDGTSIVYSIVAQPPNGTLVGNGTGQWTYTPNANFNSTSADIGRIKAVSGGDTIYKYMKYTVTAVDDTPVADAQAVTVAEDSFVNITLTGSDVESSSVTFQDHSTPLHGGLSDFTGAGGVKYTPVADYFGADSFTFKVKDTTGNVSTAATVSITVTADNDAPVAEDVTVSTNEDVAKVIVLDGSDPVEGSTVSYHKVTDPSHGSVGNITNTKNITYTPTLDYNGADSFTYKVNDGNLDSNVATVNITVDPVADNPTANLNDFSVDEDSSETVNLSGNDPDSEDAALDGYMTNHGGYGTFVVSGDKKQLTFEPYANSHTNTWFSYYVKSAVSTGSRQSSVRTVNITVDPVEDDPNVSTHDWGTVYRGSTYTATLTAGDVDGNYSHAVPTNKVSTLTVDENDDFGATIGGSIVTAYDNLGNTASNYATGTVGNRTPIATAQSLTTGYGEGLAITLDSSDLDPGEVHTWTIVSGPTAGSVSTPSNAGVTTYSPGVGHYGEATFTWKVVDNASNSSSTVTCTVDTDPPPDINPPTLAVWNGSTGNHWTTSTASLAFSFTGEAGWDVTSFTAWPRTNVLSTSIASGAVHATRTGSPTAAVYELVKISKSYRQSNKHENTTSIEAAWKPAGWLAREPYPGPPKLYAVLTGFDTNYRYLQNNPIGAGTEYGIFSVGYSQTIGVGGLALNHDVWTVEWGTAVWTGLGSPISASVGNAGDYAWAVINAPGTGGIQGPSAISYSRPWTIKMQGAVYSSGTITGSGVFYWY